MNMKPTRNKSVFPKYKNFLYCDGGVVRYGSSGWVPKHNRNNIIAVRKVYVVVKEVATGIEHHREVGFMSEFFFGGEDRRRILIDEWIELRGEPQHKCKLEFVRYYIT